MAATPHLRRDFQFVLCLKQWQLLKKPTLSSTETRSLAHLGSVNLQQIQIQIRGRKMPDIPFVLNLDSPDSIYYGHDMFPNRLYRRQHARQHDALDLQTLGLIARMGAHAHHLVAKKHKDELGSHGAGKDKYGNFELKLDVGLFEPGELSVKLVNNFIVIEGKHEEREDEHGHVSRHFVRRYPLPKEYNADAIASTLTDEGVLSISVPPLVPVEDAKERIIPIKHVGPADLFVQPKNNGDKESADGEAKK